MSELVVPVAIIGGGPAGLMAAEILSQQGHLVHVLDAMPSVGRKFLLAGLGGLNITHAEAFEPFMSRYGEEADTLRPWIQAFDNQAIRDWAQGLGIETFIGSSQRIFPKEMKAAPLLRAWLSRLRQQGVVFHPRHRWLGWQADQKLCFATPEGECIVQAQATLLALGGASWPKLGSDGAWVNLLQDKGLQIQPLEASNCGFEVNWSPIFREKYAGSALKSIQLSLPDQAISRRGGIVVSEYGVEGSAIYALSRPIRQSIRDQGFAELLLDLCPDKSAERVASEVLQPRGSRSLSSHLQSKVGIKGVKLGLLREGLDQVQWQDLAGLAKRIKACPIRLECARPITEAISTAGGVCFENLNANLMVKSHAGLFLAGEMLNWDAPTGGYLITACLAMGRHVGQGMHQYLSRFYS